MSKSAPALTPFKPPRLPKLDGSSTFGGILGDSANGLQPGSSKSGAFLLFVH